MSNNDDPDQTERAMSNNVDPDQIERALSNNSDPEQTERAVSNNVDPDQTANAITSVPFGCYGQITFEPSHEIMALFVFCKLILQMSMCSHPVGLGD